MQKHLTNQVPVSDHVTKAAVHATDVTNPRVAFNESHDKGSRAGSECSSNAEALDGECLRKRQYLNPDTLCDLLGQRGFGDPRSRMKPPEEDPLPLILRRQKQQMKNTF